MTAFHRDPCFSCTLNHGMSYSHWTCVHGLFLFHRTRVRGRINVCLFVKCFSLSGCRAGVTRTLTSLEMFLKHWHFLGHCRDRWVLKSGIIVLFDF